MTDIVSLLPFVLIVLVFYLLVLRPARVRQRAVAELQSRLQAGQQVITTAGLYATVVAVDDETVTLETSPGVRSRWARAAVARVLDTPGPAAGPAGPADDETDGQA